MPGPVDQRDVEDRKDVAVWTSEPLTDDLTVIGAITADLRVSSSAAEFDLVVKVCDVEPDGRSLNIVDGIQRTTSTPGEPAQVQVRVGSTAMRFARGHRIRVDVASSAYPRFDLLPSSEQTLFLAGSSVTLPVIASGETENA